MGTDTALDLDRLRPHVITLGNDGLLEQDAHKTTLPTTAETIDQILTEDFPRITRGWKRPRLLLYAHGGLVDEEPALQTMQKHLLDPYLRAEIYPLAFVWHTGLLTTLVNIGEDTAEEVADLVLGPFAEAMPSLAYAPAPPVRTAFDEIRDQLAVVLAKLDAAKDEGIQQFASLFAAVWEEMKENAHSATNDSRGGARLAIDAIDAMPGRPELHFAGHSAGSIILSYALSHAMRRDLHVKSCSLWAPACTLDLAKETYFSAYESGKLDRLQLQTLTAGAEEDDNCQRLYGRSLLHLVSQSFEEDENGVHKPMPLLGMAECINADPQSAALFAPVSTRTDWTRWDFHPANKSSAHGRFDNDNDVVARAVSWATA